MSVGLLTKGMISPPSTAVTTIGNFMVDDISVTIDTEVEVAVSLEADVTV